MFKNILLAFAFTIGSVIASPAQSPAEQDVAGISSSVKKSKPDKERVTLLLQLSSAYAGKAEAERKRVFLDSAVHCAQMAQDLSAKLRYREGTFNSLKKVLTIQARLRDLDIGHGSDGIAPLAAIDKTEASLLATFKGNDEERAQLYAWMAAIYEETQENIPVKQRLYTSALQYFRASGSKRGQANALLELGEMSLTEGKLALAKTYLLESAALYKAVKGKELTMVYYNLSSVSTYQGNYKLGLTYGLEAERTAGLYKDTSFVLADVYNYIGISYEALEDKASALKYYKKALEVAKKYNEVPMIYTVAVNVAKFTTEKDPRESIALMKGILKDYPYKDDDAFQPILMFAPKFLDAYYKTGDLSHAEQYAGLLLEASKKIPVTHPKQSSYLRPVIRYYIDVNKYTQASQYLPVLLKMGEQNGILPVIKESHYLWHLVDSAKGNYLSALNHYKTYKKLNDSSINIEKAKEVALLQVGFETEAKNKNIQLLTQQSELQKSQLQKASILRNVTFAGIALLLVISGLLYSRYRIKQRASREAQTKNEVLQHLLKEKEWLLKEVHHRVKNNLQTVVSLLESQSAYLSDDALLAIQDSQNRVYAMSLIHKKLYVSENVTSINMAVYLPELVRYLKEGMSFAGHIRFNLNIQNTELDVSQAIPAGLILNEAITNAIKYAFPVTGKNNTIDIEMDQAENSLITLVISDNGKGLPSGYENNISNGLGLKLMKGLTDDLEGNFNIQNNQGTRITIRFMARTPLHHSDKILPSAVSV